MRSPEAILPAAPARILPRPLAYGLAGLAAMFELVVAFLMLHPQVGPDYRAYYIDRTTTCLPEPVTGSYALGTTISFRSDGRKLAGPLKSCGWLDPYGEGTPTKGETARLRLAIPPRTGALELTLTLKPVVKDDTTSQRVAVSVNDVLLDTLVYSEGPARAMTVAIPAEIVHLGKGFLEVKLDLPDAISFEAGGRGSNTQKRAILLTALRLAPPVKEEVPAVILPPAYQESVGPY